MAGNSQRRGAVRKGKKGATVGSGGVRRRGLEGKGPTPKAAERENHKAYKAKQAAARKQQKQLRFSYDMLGEGARTEDDARRYQAAYVGAIQAIAAGRRADLRGGMTEDRQQRPPEYRRMHSVFIHCAAVSGACGSSSGNCATSGANSPQLAPVRTRCTGPGSEYTPARIAMTR